MHIVRFKIRVTGSASVCRFRNTTLQNRMLSISKRSVDSNFLIKNTWFPMLPDLHPYADCVTRFKLSKMSVDSNFLITNTWFPMDIAYVCRAWVCVVQGISGSKAIEAGQLSVLPAQHPRSHSYLFPPEPFFFRHTQHSKGKDHRAQ